VIETQERTTAMPSFSRKAKALASAGAAAVALTAAIGVLHTPMARPLLSKIGGCPVGKATPADIEAARMGAVRETRGVAPAPARPALGFTLDRSTPADVHAWGKQLGVPCENKREGTLVVCHAVPRAALEGHAGQPGTIDDLAFAFRPRDGRLVNITATSLALPSGDASARMQHVTGTLRASLGVPTDAAGDPTAEYLASGDYATATVQYRFSDFMAEITATNIAGRGVALREHYLSATD